MAIILYFVLFLALGLVVALLIMAFTSRERDTLGQIDQTLEEGEQRGSEASSEVRNAIYRITRR